MRTSFLIILFSAISLIAQTAVRDLSSLKWQNATPKATKITQTDKTFQFEVVGDHVWDSDYNAVTKELPKNTVFTFSADITATRTTVAYLQVKLYKDGKELQRLQSKKNSMRRKHLSVKFDSRDADTVQFLLRTSAGAAYYGVKGVMANPQLFEGNDPVAVEKRPNLEVIPSYTVCSIYLNDLQAKDEGQLKTTLRYKKTTETKWHDAMPLPFIYNEQRAAGSIVKLEENTAYDLSLDADDNGQERSHTYRFKTLAADVPVARTIMLDETSIKRKNLFTQSGTADGYVRYTCRPGFVVTAPSDSPEDAALTLSGLQYVILDNVTVRGGKRHAVSIIGCQNVIVRNCDLSGFGRVGEQRPDLDGKYFLNGKVVNMDGGLNIYATERILVEKNYIHDPNGTTNSWFHSHPAGMEAMTIGETSQATIRFNDCVGSDLHRWNDAIEGHGNGDIYGSTFQDAEIYGNLLTLGCDDGIELDGGQANCRFFYNRSEQLLCGVSTAPCLVGPSYIFQNLFADLGDVYSIKGASVKNVFSDSGKGQIFFFNNTLVSGGGFSGFGGSKGRGPERFPGLVKGVAFNNLMAGCGYFSTSYYRDYNAKSDYSLFDGNSERSLQTIESFQKDFGQEKHAAIGIPTFINVTAGLYDLADGSVGQKAGKPLPNFLSSNKPNIGAFQSSEGFPLPYRPLPFITDVQQLSIPYNNGTYSTASFKLIPSANMTAPLPFAIRINTTNPYISVSPSKGVLQPGKPLELTVSVDKTKITQARLNRAVVLVRTPDGLSRHVTIHVDSRPDAALLAKDREGVVKGKIIQKDDKWLLSFTLEKAGDYYLHAFFDSFIPGNMTKAYADGEPKKITTYGPRAANRPQWTFLGGNSYGGDGPNRPLHLEAGTHVFTLSYDSTRYETKPSQCALAPSPNLLLSPFQPLP